MVGFPLLLIPLAVYNIIAFLMPSVSFTDVLFKVPMITGETWPVTLADLLLALGVVLLLLEVVKGARPGSKFVMDHLLSLIVFGAAAAEFVMWPKFGNSTSCWCCSRWPISSAASPSARAAASPMSPRRCRRRVRPSVRLKRRRTNPRPNPNCPSPGSSRRPRHRQRLSCRPRPRRSRSPNPC